VAGRARTPSHRRSRPPGPVRGQVRGEHADLAVLDPARGARVLAGDAGRHATLLQELSRRLPARPPGHPSTSRHAPESPLPGHLQSQLNSQFNQLGHRASPLEPSDTPGSEDGDVRETCQQLRVARLSQADNVRTPAKSVMTAPTGSAAVNNVGEIDPRGGVSISLTRS
jgi:hypothetical protein